MTDRQLLEDAARAADPDPTCGKCGAPITTGMMAVLCPRGRQCEFVMDDEHWEQIEDFRQDLSITRAAASIGEKLRQEDALRRLSKLSDEMGEEL